MFNTAYLSDEIQASFSNLSQHELPFFMLIRFDGDKESMLQIVKQSIEGHQTQWASFEVAADLLFAQISCSATNIHLTASTICSFLGQDERIAQILIVQPDGSTDPLNTYKYCFKELEKLVAEYDGQRIFTVEAQTS